MIGLRARVTTLVLAGLMGVASLGCGDSSTSPSSGGFSTAGSGTSGSTVSASVDGTSFAASTVTATVRTNILTISATTSSGGTTTSLAMALPATVGTQRVAPGTGVSANYQVTTGTSVAGWTAVDGTGSGNISLATLTSTRASGTFLFTVTAATGSAAGPRNITGGTFDVALTQ